MTLTLEYGHIRRKMVGNFFKFDVYYNKYVQTPEAYFVIFLVNDKIGSSITFCKNIFFEVFVYS